MNGALRRFALLGALLLTVACAMPQRAVAQAEAASSDATSEAAIDAAAEAKIVGPSRIDLLDQAILDLAEGYAFVPAGEAARLVAMWEGETEDLVGLVSSDGKHTGWWMVTIYFSRIGYVQDIGARHWDPDHLLNRVCIVSEKENARRRDSRSTTTTTIVGWLELPSYDAAARHLSASIIVRDTEVGSDDREFASYGVDPLGRDGYFSFVLVTSLSSFQEHRMHMQRLLQGFTYRYRKWHKDFDPATDRVSEHGLDAVLVGEAK